MRIVLDTNVLISGVFFSGPPYRILQAWRDRRIHLCISLDIFDEYERVGQRLAHQFPDVDLLPILHLITVKATMVKPARLLRQVCDDPDDDKFLACALASKVKTIVSGDKLLLNVTGFRGITVMSPRAFVDAHLT